MKLLKPGGAYYAEFTTQRFDTGAATNADTLPLVTANKNGVDDAAFVLTAANLDAGRYKITGTVPAGYVAGDFVNVTVAATVNAVAGKGVVDSFQVVTGLPGTDAIPAAVSDKTGFSLTVTPPTKEDISTKVWGETIRALTDKDGFSGSGTVTDKTGFALATAPPTKEEIATQVDVAGALSNYGAAKSEYAYTTSFGSNKDIKFTSLVGPGIAIDRIANVLYVTQPLEPTWPITVPVLATANQVVAAISAYGWEGHDPLISASLAPGSDGTGVFANGATETYTLGLVDIVESVQDALDRLNDIAAPDVWAVEARALTDKSGFSLATAPPTKEEIAAQVDVPTAGEIDTELSGVHGSGTWGNEAPVGSKPYSGIIQAPAGTPQAGVQVEAYSNLERTALVDVKLTDVNGLFTMYLNPGNYYMKAVKQGIVISDWLKVVAA